MILLLTSAAIAFAAGVWLLVSSLFPAPPPLAEALQRLHDTRRPVRTILPTTAPTESTLVRLGQSVLDRSSSDLLSSEQVLMDLEVVRRPVEVHAGYTAAAAIAGSMLGPVLWTILSIVGTPLPALVPVALMPLGAIVGALLPRVLLQSEADQARTDFRHALGAYLDILVLLLAAGMGAEGAMRQAAHAGNGPAFMELRRATTKATYSGAVWNALDELGQRVGIVEVREIAAAGMLSGERGAAVRRSLVAKARSLRTSTLTAAEVAARKQSQAMFAPIVLIGFAFITFLMYPLVTNLDVG